MCLYLIEKIKDTCEVKIKPVLFIAIPSLADQPLDGIGQVHIRERVRHVRVSDFFRGRRTVDNDASRGERLVATACYYVRLDMTTYLRTFVWNKKTYSIVWCASNPIKHLAADKMTDNIIPQNVRYILQKQFKMFMGFVSESIW